MDPVFSTSHNYAEDMTVTPPESEDWIKIRMIYESQSEQSLTITWMARAAGATGFRTETKHAVPFEPTAVARKAGSSDTFYVVGWLAEPERVVVEKWVIQPLALGTLITPAGETKTTLSDPEFGRELVWTSQASEMAPIWDAAVLPYSNELWMIAYGDIARIYSLDLKTETIALLYASDASGMSELAGVRAFAVGKHPTSGFVVMASKRRPWKSMFLNPDSAMFVAIDEDCDGVVDSVLFDAVSNYQVLFPSPWDLTYTAR
jgi:hypothetical protein